MQEKEHLQQALDGMRENAPSALMMQRKTFDKVYFRKPQTNACRLKTSSCTPTAMQNSNMMDSLKRTHQGDMIKAQQRNNTFSLAEGDDLDTKKTFANKTSTSTCTSCACLATCGTFFATTCTIFTSTFAT